MLGIIYKGRDVIVRVGHVGISRELTEKVMLGSEYEKELEKAIGISGDKIVIVSVDKMSPLSGIKNKLIAYKDLLKNHPEQKNELLMMQYCTPSSKSIFIDEVSAENRELVKEINHLYPNSIIYEEGPVSADQRLALFHRGEILLITALRDGFNLLPFEFMMVKDINKSYPGTIIMSEFAGCVTAMSSIKRINPYHISEISDTIYNSIASHDTSFEEIKFQHDLQYILQHNAEYWLKSLIEDMKRGHNKNETATFLGAIDEKLLKANRFFKRLTVDDVEKAYQTSINRVILLDSEVTPYFSYKVGYNYPRNSSSFPSRFRYCNSKIAPDFRQSMCR